MACLLQVKAMAPLTVTKWPVVRSTECSVTASMHRILASRSKHQKCHHQRGTKRAPEGLLHPMTRIQMLKRHVLRRKVHQSPRRSVRQSKETNQYRHRRSQRVVGIRTRRLQEWAFISELPKQPQVKCQAEERRDD